VAEPLEQTRQDAWLYQLVWHYSVIKLVVRSYCPRPSVDYTLSSNKSSVNVPYVLLNLAVLSLAPHRTEQREAIEFIVSLGSIMSLEVFWNKLSLSSIIAWHVSLHLGYRTRNKI